MEIKSRSELYKIIDTSLPSVELGVAEGLFTREILSWGTPVHYAVDNWSTIYTQTGDGAFDQGWHDKNYASVKAIDNPRIKIMPGISWAMARDIQDNSIGFLYIDACHSYECVMKDLNAWFPKVKCGSVIAGHDWGNPDIEVYGVQRAVMEFVGNKFDLKIIPENGIDSSFYFVKTC